MCFMDIQIIIFKVGGIMTPIKLYQILNKKPKDVVTAEEWNEILTLLVEQANLFSDKLQGFQSTLKQIIDGKLEGVEISANVNSFGGKPPEDYTLDTELEEAINELTQYINAQLDTKMSKVYYTPSRLITAGPDGILKSTSIADYYLSGITSNVQTQLNNKLGINQTASDTLKVDGKKVTISQTEPTNPSVGDVWISW